MYKFDSDQFNEFSLSSELKGRLYRLNALQRLCSDLRQGRLDRKKKGGKIREVEEETLSDSVREEQNANPNLNFVKPNSRLPTFCNVFPFLCLIKSC